jgi:2-methylcitrate dehydratase PrpD
MSVTMPSSKELAAACDRVAAVRYEDVPPEAVARLKHALLDFLGVALMGYAASNGAYVAYAGGSGAAPQATLIGDGTRTGLATAAGVNAQFAYDTDFDETGAGNHGFSPIAGTALAFAEHLDRDGRALIAALAAAYQLNGKFHRSLIPGRPAGSTRHHAVNSAVCAGKLMGFNGATLAHAVELAWTLAPVDLDVLFASHWWDSLGQGNLLNCHAGVTAAQLIANGVPGPVGLVAADAMYDLENVARFDEPSPFSYVLQELHLKPWMGSRGTHGAIQLATEIVAAERLAPDDIEEVTFACREIYLRHPFNCPSPSDHAEAVYSVQWTIANAILRVPAGPRWADDASLRDDSAHRLAARVRLTEDLEATAIWKSGRRFAPELKNTLTIRARGQEFRRSLLAADFLGSPSHPMSAAQVTEKFRRLADPVVGPERARGVVAYVDDLERQTSIGALLELLAKARAEATPEVTT